MPDVGHAYIENGLEMDEALGVLSDGMEQG
jgi:hypothetical protein